MFFMTRACGKLDNVAFPPFLRVTDIYVNRFTEYTVRGAVSADR